MGSNMAVTYAVGPIKRHQFDKSYRLVDAAGRHFDLQGWGQNKNCSRRHAAFINQRQRPLI